MGLQFKSVERIEVKEINVAIFLRRTCVVYIIVSPFCDKLAVLSLFEVTQFSSGLTDINKPDLDL